MQILHWQTSTRFYHAELSEDLFASHVLELSWGGRGRRPQGRITHPFGTLREAATALLAVERRRVSRGYSLVFEVPHDPSRH